MSTYAEVMTRIDLRVTHRATVELRHHAGLVDWTAKEIRQRVYAQVLSAREQGMWWPWRFKDTEAVPFDLKGQRYVAIVGDDVLFPPGRAVVMVLKFDERDERQAAEAASRAADAAGGQT